MSREGTKDYRSRDRQVWEGIFRQVPAAWFSAPPSDAMVQAKAWLQARPCHRLLDLGCGFGRWARYLAGPGVAQVVGVDYAHGGARIAAAWARQDGFEAAFAVASALELPFSPASFDAVLAALLLDNLSREDRARAVQEVERVLTPGGRGFFIFSPHLSPEDLLAASENNPTRSCMHVVYDDEELTGCLPGWRVERQGTSAEGLRILEGIFPGG